MLILISGCLVAVFLCFCWACCTVTCWIHFINKVVNILYWYYLLPSFSTILSGLIASCRPSWDTCSSLASWYLLWLKFSKALSSCILEPRGKLFRSILYQLLKPCFLLKNPFVLYVIKFVGAYCLLYFGTQAVIGLAADGRYYSSFVHDYLDYPTLLRNTLLFGAKTCLSLVGYHSYAHDSYYLTMMGGRGVRMVYSCLGIGLISFWTAFVVANKGSIKKKLLWIIAGLLSIWLINVARVALLLLAINKNWTAPFHFGNHTLFNIAVYTAILMLIFFYDRSTRTHMAASNATQ